MKHHLFLSLFLLCTVAALGDGAAGEESGQSAADRQALESAVDDLPLEVLPPAEGKSSEYMVIHWTGDGGWGITDAGLSRAFASRGIPVAGMNALKYFWTPRDTAQCSRDLDHIIRYYSALWHRPKIVLIGYSFGADVVPFMYNRLSEESRKKVAVLVEIGPSKTADFHFHLSSWFGIASSSSLPVMPELMRINRIPVLSVVGDDDDETIGRDLNMANVTHLEVTSGHRVGHNYEPILQAILKLIGAQ